MGVHGATFSKADPYLAEGKQMIYKENNRLVGQRGIAYRWPDTLELLVQQLWDGELLLRSITPCLASHVEMKAFHGSFC